jgi:Protein of unknown function (DUF1593).
MRFSNIVIAAAAGAFLLSGCSQYPKLVEDYTRPRVIVTCDPELDDNNSMIRYVLYSPDFQTEGLIYTSSQFHWKGDGKGTKWYVPGREYERFGVTKDSMTSWRWNPNERFIDDIVDAYEKCYPNLKVHDRNYPAPEELRSKIKWGNVDFDGEMDHDTDGSNLIKEIMLDDKPGPVFILGWGGSSTIARALKSIADENQDKPGWDSLKKKISEKCVLIGGDQDNLDTKYIKPNWPDIGRFPTRGGTVSISYNSQDRAKPEDKVYYSPEWMEKYISSKGPFGQLQRVWGDGKQMVPGDVMDPFGISYLGADSLKKLGYVIWTPVIEPKGAFLGEGDTGTFLNLMNIGLRSWWDVTWGGMGGRKKAIPEPEESIPAVSEWSTASADSAARAALMTKMMGPDPVIPDFLPDAMNGLAARFAWSVTPNYKDANHYPVVKGPLALEGKPGETLKLKCKVSDPDGNEVKIAWWNFRVGTYKGDEIKVADPSAACTSFIIPEDAKPGQTIHFVVKAEDNGDPVLARYHRVVVTVK